MTLQLISPRYFVYFIIMTTFLLLCMFEASLFTKTLMAWSQKNKWIKTALSRSRIIDLYHDYYHTVKDFAFYLIHHTYLVHWRVWGRNDVIQ